MDGALARSSSFDVREDEGRGSEFALWTPESPFLHDVLPALSRTDAVTSSARAFGPPMFRDSPFVPEFESDEGIQPQSEEYSALVSELHEQNFEDSLVDVANELATVVEGRFTGEVEDPARHRQAVERAAREYLEPLAKASARMIDRVDAGLAGKDLGTLSQSELEELGEELAVAEPMASPAFENFLGGLRNKIKKAVGKVTKFLPHNVIMGKLKKLVRPLLERVLRFAVDKLPVSLRPLAKKLGEHFLRKEVSEEAISEASEEAAADPSILAREFDEQLAGYITHGEAFEEEFDRVQVMDAGQPVNAAALAELDSSRGRFTQDIGALKEGEHAAPLVEQFVPAILGALKMGISVIGRPKVVAFLASNVARYIARYVGKEQATTLSKALVDTGLRLVSLEASPVSNATAPAQALAATVEETVNRLVEAAPAAAYDSEPVLESYLYEAFEKAAAANFPDELIRPELHEASSQSGVWTALPANTARKRYKKFSRIIEITVTPQQAANVKSFRGAPLADFLKDRLGLSTDKPIKARVHLYEAMAGGGLPVIALHEKQVPGLGTARREAWAQIHPLTPEAAGILLNEPGLGKPVRPRFLVKRTRIERGGRFYFLEIPGAKVKMYARALKGPLFPAHSSQTRVMVDVPRRELRVFLYYSEKDATKLAADMRAGRHFSTIATLLRAKLDVDLKKLISGDSSSTIKVINEATSFEEEKGSFGGKVAEVVIGYIVTWVLDALKREVEGRWDPFVAEFARAVDQPADGATICIVFRAPAFVTLLSQIMQGGMNPVAAIQAIAVAVAKLALETQITIHPGFYFK